MRGFEFTRARGLLERKNMDFGQLLQSAITTGGQVGVAALTPTPSKPATTTASQTTKPVATTSWIMYGVVGFVALMIAVIYFATRKS